MRSGKTFRDDLERKLSDLLRIAVAVCFTFLLIGCASVSLEGPGPERTGGFLVDYQNCNVGQDVYSPGTAGFHGVWIGLGRRHGGIDYYNDLDTPVVAAAPGTVRYVYRKRDYNNGAGMQIVLDHGSFFTFYNHLGEINPSVRLGRKVSRGQEIGKIGLTGASTSPHLHFALLYQPRHGGTLPNVHSYWHVPKPDRDAKVVKVPYFDPSLTYENDDLITSPILFSDCKKV